MQTAMLGNYPALRTRNPDQLQAWLAPNFAIQKLEMPDRGRRFDSVTNHCELPSLSLTYSSYGSPVTAWLTQNDFFMQGFPVAGTGEARWNRRTTTVERQSGGIAGGPGSDMMFDYDAAFAHLILKISPAALARKLNALIGKPIDPPIEIVAQRGCDPRLRAAQFRLLRFLAEELDHGINPWIDEVKYRSRCRDWDIQTLTRDMARRSWQEAALCYGKRYKE